MTSWRPPERAAVGGGLGACAGAAQRGRPLLAWQHAAHQCPPLEACVTPLVLLWGGVPLLWGCRGVLASACVAASLSIERKEGVRSAGALPGIAAAAAAAAALAVALPVLLPLLSTCGRLTHKHAAGAATAPSPPPASASRCAAARAPRAGGAVARRHVRHGCPPAAAGPPCCGEQ